eukprot:357315-Chlamydomonas_euryale.AAC.3
MGIPRLGARHGHAQQRASSAVAQWRRPHRQGGRWIQGARRCRMGAAEVVVVGALHSPAGGIAGECIEHIIGEAVRPEARPRHLP